MEDLPRSTVLEAAVNRAVLTVTLNRPEKLNALNAELMGDLRALWAAVALRSDIRCVVVTGAGAGFCSGADLDLLGSDRHDAAAGARDELSFLPGGRLEVPVICAINGVCAGGGLHFVADADIAIAADTATFLDPHVSVGHVSALEPLTLALRMRTDALRRMVLLGSSERLDATAARAAGLVSEVVAADELTARAQVLAHAIAAASPEAVAASRRILREFEHDLLGAHLDAGWEAIRRHWSHPDAREGPAAAVERRPPDWSPRRAAPADGGAPSELSDDEAAGLLADARAWTNVYVQFNLPGAVRRRLDEHLRRSGTTLGREFGTTLRRCLEDVGIDADRALTRPPQEDGPEHSGH
jgi:enoyl-CoA hydratase/carnithine racemase